ncbi:cytochrome P450 94C1 [Aegilops tauschii subsp. strangulata]|nr:cytochrome P450 94C1 [Aegilops tauschii subsp. strangulata]
MGVDAALHGAAAEAALHGALSLQPHVAGAFFALAACTVALAALLAVARTRPPWWCDCAVCEAYLTASWAGEFDNLCDWYAHLLRRSPSQTVHVHVLRNVLTANPVTVDHMLRARFDNYPKGKPFSAILADLLGRGIFNVDGDAWLFQRKLAAAELASPALRAFASGVVASELRGRLVPLLDSACSHDDDDDDDGGKVLDLQDVFRRFAFDCICKISFGLDPGCLELSMPVSAFVDAFDTASMLSARRATAPLQIIWRLKRFFNVGDERKLRESVRLVDGFAAEVTRQRHKLGGAASGSDLLSRFMGSISDEKYLRDIVVSFMLAGRDTIASALTAFFLLLSDHPEVAAAIRDEVSRVAGDDDNGRPSFSKLKDMHYVHAALYESMRLFPPVQFDSKFAAGDDTLPDGTAVAKGTRVTYHAYAMGRMESVWGPDCSEFRPERWLRDGQFVPVSPYRYPVFQAGVRVCVGKDLALMEMKAVIVAVVRGFDIEAIDRSSRRPKFAPGLTATFAGGLPVRVRRRGRPASGHSPPT